MDLENFDDIIEESYDTSDSGGCIEANCESAKKGRKKRCPSRTESQIEFLKKFAVHLKSFSEERSAEFKASAWEVLSKQLNDLGPPTHTINEWKKIWSEHKSKSKATFVPGEDDENDHTSWALHGSLTKNIFTVMIQQNMVTKHIQTSMEVLSDLQKKMITIMEEQKMINDNMQKVFAVLN